MSAWDMVEGLKTMESIQAINRKLPELRDLFAMQALNGLLACNTEQGYYDDFAQKAYSLADEMLKARKEKKND